SIGILPGGGGTQRLTRLVGPARASEMILTAAVVDGQTAERYGLVNHLVDGDVVAAAMGWAKRAAALYPDAVGYCKKLIQMAATDTPLEEGLRMESSLFIDLSGRPEVLELMAASRRGINPEEHKA
ncbi:MAG: enoyl-CoA hydratase/isomerase family protein, partial [Alphaproteobacteria bacterium]